MNRLESGVGLIEVLIALVVFSLGVVGMAGLQLRALGMSMDSSQRTIVIAKSQDIADRVRSNGIPLVYYTDTYNSASCAAAPAQRCDDTFAADATECSPVQMAAFDVWDVFCGNNSGLDSGAMDEGVIGWTTVISCPAGCGVVAAQMDVTTTWISRASDTDSKVSGNTMLVNGAQVSTVTDQMTLSFVP